LVQLSVSHLIKHCEANEPVLKNIDPSLSAQALRNKLLFYEDNLHSSQQLCVHTSTLRSPNQLIL
jgi:hypothetical protein